MEGYIGHRKILSVTEVEKVTPAQGKVFRVLYEDGYVEEMPEKRFALTRTTEAGDATGVQKIMHNALASMIYSLMHEYGVYFGEVNGILDTVADRAQNASDKATNILYGVEYPTNRTLNQINDILINHAAKQSTTTDNESTPAGSGPTS